MRSRSANGPHTAHYPRRKRALFPLRWHSGTFSVEGNRVRVSMAAGAPPCWLRLCRPIPYPTGSLRSVTLFVDTGALVLDVTAGLEVDDHDIDPDRVAGVDLGIIHPIAARHHMDARRSCPASGRPAYHDGESLAANQPCEDQPTPRPNSANAG